jgi:hypothetical protein
VIANPKPQETVWAPDGESAIVQRNAGRPDFVAVAITDFLELERRVLRVCLQQSELLICPLPHLRRQYPKGAPKIRACTVLPVSH